MDEKEKKCGICNYSALDMNLFIPHFRAEHQHESIKIKVPLYDVGNKRKYSLMNYNISISDLGEVENFSFDKKLNLTKQSSSPDHKKIKLVSTPCKKVLNFENASPEGPETSKSFDFTELASPLCSNKECQTDSSDDPLISEMCELVPHVCKFLSEKDPIHKERFMQFMVLMASNKFPVENICYSLFMDIIQWYSSSSTTEVRYSENVKRFWFIGKCLFHNKFLEFMGGMKSKGTVLEGDSTQGHYDPFESRINFAVPRVPETSGNIPKKIYPGVIMPMIEDFLDMSPDTENRSFNLSFDFKKINASKHDKLGGIDLTGYEKSPTKRELDDRLKHEFDQIKHLEGILESLVPNERLSQQKQVMIVNDLKELIHVQSLRIKELRSCLSSKEYGLKKVLDRAAKESEKDWKKTKFAFVISFMKTAVISIKEAIHQLLDTIDRCCAILASIQGSRSSFTDSQHLILAQQANFMCMTGLKKDDMDRLDISAKTHSFMIEQKSQMWFDMRMEAKVTGSSANAAVGLSSLKEQKEHFNRVIITKAAKEFPDDVKRRLKHGTDNEINAKATLIGKVLPCYHPSVVMRDIGCYVSDHNGQTFFVTSPDGEGLIENIPVMTFELKCPFPKSYGTTIFYEVPNYYIPQILSQMNVRNGDEALNESVFLCWTEESSTAFKVKNDVKLWDDMYSELLRIYGQDKPVIPRQKSDLSKELQKRIGVFQKENVEFLGEFKSLFANECHHSSARAEGIDSVFHAHTKQCRASNSKESMGIITSQLEQALRSVKDNIEHAALLSKPRATDVLVYLLSDLDRVKRDDGTPMAIPVYYGLSGKSIPVENLRNLTDDLVKQLQEKGIHILCKGFDGQMFKLAVTDGKGDSLTLLQQQKQLWARCCKDPKSQVISNIINMIEESNIDEAGENGQDACQILPVYPHADNTAKAKLSQLNYLLVKSIGEVSKILHFEGSEEQVLFEKSAESVKNALQHQQRNEFPETEVVPPQVFEGFEISDHDLLEIDVQEVEALLAEVELEYDSQILNGLNGDENMEDIDTVGFEDLNFDALLESSGKENTMPAPLKTPKHIINDADMRQMLGMLKTGSTKMSKKWENVNEQELKMKFTSAETIKKAFSVEELKLCHKVIKEKCVGYKSLHLKAEYVNMFSTLIGDGSSVPSKAKVEVDRQKTLRQVLQGEKKRTLCVILCNLKWPGCIKSWKSTGFYDDSAIEGLEHDISWFTQPEMFEGQPIFSFLDFHHLHTNVRCHLARHGYVDAGIQKEAWRKVAVDEKRNKSGLNVAYVDDVIDPQSAAVAKIFFSEKVEKEMRCNGDILEADHCQRVRNWYMALDERGISCLTRIAHLLEMRKWLLSLLIPKLIQFPPPTSHVASIPVYNFEGILISTERAIQMFSQVKGGSYSFRALGSQMNETYFASFRDLDANGNGVLRLDELPRAISVSCQILEARLDPDKSFHMNTTKRQPVYAEREFVHHHMHESPVLRAYDQSDDEHMYKIKPQDHPCFDVPALTKSRSAKTKVNHPDQSAHGCMPIRVVGNHKRNEEKILPHIRAGVQLD